MIVHDRTRLTGKLKIQIKKLQTSICSFFISHKKKRSVASFRIQYLFFRCLNEGRFLNMLLKKFYEQVLIDVIGIDGTVIRPVGQVHGIGNGQALDPVFAGSDELLPVQQSIGIILKDSDVFIKILFFYRNINGFRLFLCL